MLLLVTIATAFRDPPTLAYQIYKRLLYLFGDFVFYERILFTSISTVVVEWQYVDFQ